MAEVDEIRNGEIERKAQKEHLIGNDSIVTYVLSEHEFETLGEYKDIAIHLAIGTTCVGLFFPSILNLFINPSTLLFKFVNFGLAIGSLVGSLYSLLNCRRKIKRYVTVYDQLKEKAKEIRSVSQESQ